MHVSPSLSAADMQISILEAKLSLANRSNTSLTKKVSTLATTLSFTRGYPLLSIQGSDPPATRPQSAGSAHTGKPSTSEQLRRPSSASTHNYTASPSSSAAQPSNSFQMLHGMLSSRSAARGTELSWEAEAEREEEGHGGGENEDARQEREAMLGSGARGITSKFQNPTSRKSIRFDSHVPNEARGSAADYSSYGLSGGADAGGKDGEEGDGADDEDSEELWSAGFKMEERLREKQRDNRRASLASGLRNRIDTARITGAFRMRTNARESRSQAANGAHA